jgi:4-amino-4-deoxy-L-arabinose transferase-like glycosyltransferase
MLAAFVVLPTFYLVYLLTTPATWFRKIGQLAAATILLAAVSLSWSIIVDLIPENSRPYIGGSQNNSAVNLALGYNGLGRIFDKQRPRRESPSQQQTDEAHPPQNAGKVPPMMPSSPGIGGSPGMHETSRRPFGGPPRAWRFAGATLSEQITWLFPLAFFGTWAGLLSTGWRRPIEVGTIATLIWAGWLLTHLVVFSFARGIFHDYYTVVMGPAVAALLGIGLPALWQAFVNGGWRSSLLPTAFLATAAWQAILIGRYHVELHYHLLPIVFGGACLSVALLVSSETLRRIWPRIAWKLCGAVIGCVAALIGPALWSLSTTMDISSSQFPTANAAWLTGNPRAVFLSPPDIDRSGNSILPLVEYLLELAPRNAHYQRQAAQLYDPRDDTPHSSHA